MLRQISLISLILIGSSLPSCAYALADEAPAKKTPESTHQSGAAKQVREARTNTEKGNCNTVLNSSVNAVKSKSGAGSNSGSGKISEPNDKEKPGSSSASSKKSEPSDKEKPGSSSASNKKSEPSDKDSAKTDKKEKTGSRKHHSVFVPPPPPSVPTMGELGIPGMGGTMVFMGENIDYMPASELKDLKTKCETDLDRARRSVDELITGASEKKQRAESFDQLFAEGVVSRRELEQSKSDADKISLDLKDAKQTLQMLEQKYARIEKRLSDLSKTRAATKSGTKTSKAHH